MTNDRVSNEDIVKAWQAAKCPADAAKALGMKTNCLRSRVHHLRRLGVPLKTYREHNIDVAALKKLVDSLGAKEQPCSASQK